MTPMRKLLASDAEREIAALRRGIAPGAVRDFVDGLPERIRTGDHKSLTDVATTLRRFLPNADGMVTSGSALAALRRLSGRLDRLVAEPAELEEQAP